MNLKLETLANGLVFASAHLPGLRSAAIGVWLRVGARHEASEHAGLAHFMEHMAFKGTHRRDARQISFEAEHVGATMNAWTARDHTAYYVSLLGDQAPMAIDLLADVVRESTFPSDEIEREREVILQEIAESADDPQELAQHGFDQIAFPDQSLGRPILGDAGSIRLIDRACFKRWSDAHHVGRNLIVVGAGAVNHDEFRQQIATHFNDLPAGGLIARPQAACYVGGYRHHRGSFAQTTLALGWPIPGREDPRHLVFELLADLLGGGMSSPLFQSIRERHGLAYTVDAWVDIQDDCGVFQVSAAMAPRNLGAVLDLACAEVCRLAQSIDPRDVERVRNQHRAALWMSLERPLGMAESIARELLTRGAVPSVEEQIARVEAIGIDEFQRAAQDLLQTAPSLCVVGKAGREKPYERVLNALSACRGAF